MCRMCAIIRCMFTRHYDNYDYDDYDYATTTTDYDEHDFIGGRRCGEVSNAGHESAGGDTSKKRA